ncbi:DeoR/GlpR family DNA-binding transcription regulator [Plantibacter sp. YIM 135347]|uniref:DeoR/GlpR family DNA-binding transcription regulator n=1 Tax=Plantibacter sp. YIM 135347 TaxID=3423919 RepID=UPI003D356722
MFTTERHALLLERLRRDGKLVAKGVARELDVSEDTIRRDLRELASAGLCQRVYGGAVPASPATSPYEVRTTLEPESKARVAKRAAELIEPGSTAILDGGTTTLAVVAALDPGLQCTIITHSPTIAVALMPHELIDVYLIGGTLFRHSAVTSGAAALEATAGLSADLFLLGVTGIHPTEGLTTGDADEAAMKRALARRAADTYVLGSREKIGAASRYLVLPLDGVTGIVTDASADDPTITELVERSAPLLFAP